MIADPPFDEESLREIEQALGIALPEDYRRLLLAYPFAPDADRAFRELFDDKNGIIDENRIHREMGFFGQKWPDNWLIIGGDGTGGNYFLDLTRKPPPVFCADHERTAHSDRIEPEDVAPNVAVWIEEIKQEEAEALAWEQKREHATAAWEQEQKRKIAERKANKKWWQFWI